jgi:predicted nucleic acid-binding protein
VAAFAARSDHRPDPVVIPSSVRDPDDDYLVAFARTADADALVSIDRDPLATPIDHIAIRTPSAFLQQLARV